jgi:2-C-methyl-D-erythritol 2,4-cyclodiphosphate synthase
MATSGGKGMRVGIGFDAHRLVEGRKLVLGGVTIPFEKGLLGHSDADVLVHAINDALLGAAALGDIGMHFPDTDMRYKDINSLLLLKRVGELLKQAGFGVVNIDSVVCAQRPRLSPYIQKMRQNIAETLNIPEDKVSVKATTTEGMGYEGRGEGISAQAICMIKKL